MINKLLFVIFTVFLFCSCHNGEIKSYQKTDVIINDTLDIEQIKIETH